MKNRLCLMVACVCCLIAIGGFAQSQPQSPTGAGTGTAWKFRSVEYAGLLSGEKGEYGEVQTINGAYHGPWFLGIGVGLDWYRYLSLPLFLSVTRELMPDKNGLFITADLGTNRPLYHRPAGSYLTSNFSDNGLYYNAGLGYKIHISSQGDHQVLSFNVAYSYKQLEEDITDYSGPSRYTYRNRRLVFRIGFQF